MSRFLFIPLFALLLGCQNEKLNKYIYFDSNKCLHTNKECAEKVTIMDTCDIEMGHLRFVCTKCVLDQHYEVLHAIAQKKRDEELRIINKNKNKAELFDVLSVDYDMGTYKHFIEDIDDPVKRKKLYDAICDEYELEDYETFSRKLDTGEDNFRCRKK